MNDANMLCEWITSVNVEKKGYKNKKYFLLFNILYLKEFGLCWWFREVTIVQKSRAFA